MIRMPIERENKVRESCPADRKILGYGRDTNQVDGSLDMTNGLYPWSGKCYHVKGNLSSHIYACAAQVYDDLEDAFDRPWEDSI